MFPLYKNIKILREKKGLSQQALADLIGYTSRSSIAKIESGEVDLPQSKIAQFASVLNVTPAELMGLHEMSLNIKQTFANNLNNYMSCNNVDINQLADVLKKNPKDISAWLTAIEAPTVEDVQKLADFFKITPEDFNQVANIPSYLISLSCDEKNVIDMYRALSQSNKNAVLNLIKNLSNS